MIFDFFKKKPAKKKWNDLRVGKKSALPAHTPVSGIVKNSAATSLCTSDQKLRGIDSYDLTWNYQWIDRVFATSAMVGSIVGAGVDEITRRWIEFVPDEHYSHEEILQIEDAIDRLNIKDIIVDALTWSMLYGGSIILIDVRGEELAEPLNIEGIESLDDVTLFSLDRWQVYPMAHIDFDHPWAYQKTSPTLLVRNGDKVEFNGEMNYTARIDVSRTIRLKGFCKVSQRERQRHMGWGISILERMFDEIKWLEDVIAQAGLLVRRANMRTIKINGMLDAMTNDGDISEMQKRLDWIAENENNMTVTWLDALDDMQRDSYDFSGLDKIIEIFKAQIAMARQTPMDILFGQSTQGFATGEEETNRYHERTHAEQERHLKPIIKSILKLICGILFKDKDGILPTFEFRSLMEMEQAEKADIAAKDENTIMQAFQSDLITKECALKELLALSKITGRFTNILDSDIVTAKEEDAIRPPSFEQMQQEQPEYNKQESPVNDAGD